MRVPSCRYAVWHEAGRCSPSPAASIPAAREAKASRPRGHPQEVAGDLDLEREGERRDQIDLGGRREPVGEAPGRVLDSRSHLFDLPPGEGGGQQPGPRVLGRVGVRHVPDPALPGPLRARRCTGPRLTIDGRYAGHVGAGCAGVVQARRAGATRRRLPDQGWVLRQAVVGQSPARLVIAATTSQVQGAPRSPADSTRRVSV